MYFSSFKFFCFLSVSLFRNQGGVVSGVLPEALLDYDNYLEWIEQQSKSKYIILYEDETSFKEASERAWTCVLMQAIKVILLVLKQFSHFFDVTKILEYQGVC